MTFKKHDTRQTTATTEFNYHDRGFYCSNCGAKLNNTYEVSTNDNTK